MGRASMNTHSVDFADVQGIVRFGYGRMTRAAYTLVRVKDAAAARRWLRSAPITSAVTMQPPPVTALNIAFTAAGLRALGVNESIVSGFSHEFRGGMAEESRARQLGDVEANAPEHWHWGTAGREPHALVMFFAEPGNFSAFVESVKGAGWLEGFTEILNLPTTDLDGIEPFGFADGISQPKIDWDQAREPTRPQMEYTNMVALGEILLGYRNEYDKLTERPLLENNEQTADLPAAEEAPAQRDLGRNGTYLVMRQLEQDVRGFWQFMHAQSGGDAAEAGQLANAFVGRTRSGDPLVATQGESIPGIEKEPEQAGRNQFTYENDPAGVRCPFGAHVRRANPRSTDYPGRPSGLRKILTMLGFGPRGFHDDLISSARFHRILRRGREYGPELLPEDALTPGPPDEPRRGLHFICLNANIARQFEFIQNAWMANTKFAALTNESDPLVGTRAALPGCPVTSDFHLPRDGRVRRRISGLPQFVTMRGGAYFFLPSLRALRYFSRE